MGSIIIQQKIKSVLESLSQQLEQIKSLYPISNVNMLENWANIYKSMEQLEYWNNQIPGDLTSAISEGLSSEALISSTTMVSSLENVLKEDEPFDARNKTKKLIPMPRFTATKRIKKLTPPSSPPKNTPWLSFQEARELLGLDNEKFEELLLKHGIRPMTINGEKMFSLNEMSWLKESISSQVGEGGNEAVQQYMSSIQLTSQFQFIQEQGCCFLIDTANSYYNEQNLLTIISPRLQKSNTNIWGLMQELRRLLRQRDQLFAYSINAVEKEIDSTMFWELCQGQSKWEQWSRILLTSNLLARYYSDLALMRIAAIVLQDGKFPKNICDLVPHSILELADNIVWPPKDIPIEQKQALRNYLRHDKIWFLLERLHASSPIEFDLEQIQIPEFE